MVLLKDFIILQTSVSSIRVFKLIPPLNLIELRLNRRDIQIPFSKKYSIVKHGVEDIGTRSSGCRLLKYQDFHWVSTFPGESQYRINM